MRFRRSAVLAIVMGGAVVGDRAAATGAESPDCVDRLLGAASSNTDNFPTLWLVLDAARATEHAVALGIHANAMCSADAGAAGITYFVVDGNVGIDASGIDPDASRREVAIGESIVIVEPGGDALDRLGDPGATWSTAEGVAEVGRELSGDGVTWIRLALPNPDRSPVRALGMSLRQMLVGSAPTGELRVVWQFAAGEAPEHVGDVAAALTAAGFAGASPEVDASDTGISATIQDRGPDGLAIPDLFDLALLNG